MRVRQLGLVTATLLPLAVLVVLVVLVASCSSSSTPRGTFDEPPAPAPTSTGAPATPPLGGTGDHRSVSVTFEGTVLAPNGVLPLSNALVYVTAQKPAAIPEGASFHRD